MSINPIRLQILLSGKVLEKLLRPNKNTSQHKKANAKSE